MGLFGLSREEKLVKDTAGQIEAILDAFEMHLALSSRLRGIDPPKPGDRYLMILWGTAVAMAQVMGRDEAFAKTCVQKYLSKYNDADSIITRMTRLISMPDFEGTFRASLDAYLSFHNGGDIAPAEPYLRLAGIYLDSSHH